MGTLVRIKGIKRYTHPKTGITYCYHRESGPPLKADFGSPAFFAELASLEGAGKAVKAIPGSLGLVIIEYKRSPDWAVLRAKRPAYLMNGFSTLLD